MKKIVLAAITAAMAITNTMAEDFKTPGDGTVWTMTMLSETVASGVTKSGDKTFAMSDNVEISENDRFKIEDGITILMGDNVRLTITGEADFQAKERVLLTSVDDTSKPYGIFIDNDKSVTYFKNIDFEHAGLKNFGTYGLEADNCTFTRHNAVSGTAALSMRTSSAEFRITNCTFTECAKSAIGGAANYMNPVTIDNCTFTANGTANMNTPQLNITTAANIAIRNCKITGNPEHNMVGGIVVSNLIGLTGELNTLIENNEIRDNRFGLATYCEQTAVIKNNTIIGNNHETNPNNGGSGINIYDPYKTQTTTITGNYIEGNLWGITIIGGRCVNVGKTEDSNAADYNPGLNVFLNNGFGGTIYDLYNNSANTVYAQGNHWKSVAAQDRESIETVVFHKNDNAALGEVIFMPALESDPTSIDTPAKEETTRTETEIYTFDGTKTNITDAANLSKGIYIIKSYGEKTSVTRKITVR